MSCHSFSPLLFSGPDKERRSAAEEPKLGKKLGSPHQASRLAEHLKCPGNSCVSHLPSLKCLTDCRFPLTPSRFPSVQKAFWLLVKASSCQSHPPEMAGE